MSTGGAAAEARCALPACTHWNLRSQAISELVCSLGSAYPLQAAAPFLTRSDRIQPIWRNEAPIVRPIRDPTSACVSCRRSKGSL